MKKYIIGTNALGRHQMRNFAGLPFQNFKIRKVYDLCKIADYIIFKIFNANNEFLLNFYYDFGLNKVDIYHFFNAITPLKKPWVVTYETALPRYRLFPGLGSRFLASDNCKKIIALTDKAITIQKFLLNKYPQYKDTILKKIIKLSPSQNLYVNSIEDKSYNGELIFTMAGTQFFLKGGMEILNAFEKLIHENYPVKLNIISSLEINPGMTPYITGDDRKKALFKINKYAKIIKYYRSLPYNQLIEIFKQSHIGLLPSYYETYGCSALDAMSCGCPVIVTNVPPFPEFIKEEFGWLIEVKQVYGSGTYFSDIGSRDKTREFSKKLTEGIYATIKKICEEPNIVKDKAMHAIANIEKNHNPINAAAILEKIYLQAIG